MKFRFFEFIVLLIFFTLLISRGRRKPRKKQPLYILDEKPLIDDEQLLRLAEESVAAPENGMINIKTFSSEKGYSQSDLVEFVLLLQSKRILASYTSSVGGRGLTNYNLWVPAKDIEEAVAILNERLRD